MKGEEKISWDWGKERQRGSSNECSRNRSKKRVVGAKGGHRASEKMQAAKDVKKGGKREKKGLLKSVIFSKRVHDKVIPVHTLGKYIIEKGKLREKKIGS